MKGQLIAIYDLEQEEEICVGVWDTVGEAARAMQSTEKSIYRNLRQTRIGRKFSRKGYSVYRIEGGYDLLPYLY